MEVLAGLAPGQCTLEYRRGPFGYTPVGFELQNRDVVAGRGPFTGLVTEFRRGEIVARRAVCRISETVEARDEAGRQLLARLRQPPGYETPSDSTDASGLLAALLHSGVSTLRFVGRSVGIVPSELNASVVGESCPGYWAWHPDGYWICVSYELEGVTGTGEDPCDDDFGYWDDGVGEEGGCRCYSGADWGDPDTADWPCQEPDSPPDDDDPPGGQSGPGPDEVCDPDLGPCDPCDPIDEICEPAYTLSCNDAVRGATVTCTLTGSTSEIEQVEWHFTGGGLSASHIGTEPSWSGTAAVGGTVTATVSHGTEETPLEAEFEVSGRSWSWGSSDWSHSRGSGSAPAAWDTEPDWDVSYKRGQLCSAIGSGCGSLANPFVYPDFRTGAGYTLILVDGGPNHDLWYVASADLGIQTESWLNDGFLAVWTKRVLPVGSQAEECRTAMGLGPSDTVSVNFNTFNGECKGKDMVSFVRAMLDHEEDHHDMMTSAAGQTVNNAPAEIEAFVGGSETEVVSEIESELTDIDLALRTAGDASEPTGNWSSTVWIWKSSVLQYIESGLWVF